MIFPQIIAPDTGINLMYHVEKMFYEGKIMEYTEQAIRLDLEMALAQVRTTIKADCAIALLKVFNGIFAFEVIVGEQHGETEWDYPILPDNEPVPVRAVLYKGIGGAEVEEEMMWYPDPVWVDISLEDYWTEKAASMVRLFFEQNPEYHKAIQYGMDNRE